MRSPHWNLVSTGGDCVGSIFSTDHYAAAYPGNSIGGVLLITFQDAGPRLRHRSRKRRLRSCRGINMAPRTCLRQQPDQRCRPAIAIGKLSWLLTVNHEDVVSTAAYLYDQHYHSCRDDRGFPGAQQTGDFPADVVGTGALAHSLQTSMLISGWPMISRRWFRLTYSVGVWNNIQTSTPAELSDIVRQRCTPTFAGLICGFAGNKYIWDQTHLSNAVSRSRATPKASYDFDVDAFELQLSCRIFSSIRYTVDPKRRRFFPQMARSRAMDGTNWQNADAKGIWRPLRL